LNIVFDLGGVVFNWRPDKIIGHVFENPVTQRLVKTEIFEHADWVALDRGTLDFDQAVDRGAERTGLPQREIYDHLLLKHQLAAAETVFIDDMSENLDAASLLGIQTIQFINTAQCRQDLMSLGCI
jgi:FMN phosphatase YigB (HAD superfamily)